MVCLCCGKYAANDGSICELCKEDSFMTISLTALRRRFKLTVAEIKDLKNWNKIYSLKEVLDLCAKLTEELTSRHSKRKAYLTEQDKYDKEIKRRELLKQQRIRISESVKGLLIKMDLDKDYEFHNTLIDELDKINDTISEEYSVAMNIVDIIKKNHDLTQHLRIRMRRLNDELSNIIPNGINYVKSHVMYEYYVHDKCPIDVAIKFLSDAYNQHLLCMDRRKTIMEHVYTINDNIMNDAVLFDISKIVQRYVINGGDIEQYISDINNATLSHNTIFNNKILIDYELEKMNISVIKASDYSYYNRFINNTTFNISKLNELDNIICIIKNNIEQDERRTNITTALHEIFDDKSLITIIEKSDDYNHFIMNGRSSIDIIIDKYMKFSDEIVNMINLHPKYINMTKKFDTYSGMSLFQQRYIERQLFSLIDGIPAEYHIKVDHEGNRIMHFSEGVFAPSGLSDFLRQRCRKLGLICYVYYSFVQVIYKIPQNNKGNNVAHNKIPLNNKGDNVVHNKIEKSNDNEPSEDEEEDEDDEY